MIKIQYPKDQVKTRQRRGVNEVFDIVRKKWLILTPEEWVRQNILQYLLVSKRYPASLISVEKEINLGELKKRCDVVVYNRDSLPWMIIECKEMNIPLSHTVIEQILRYHITLSATYLIITNGSYTYGFQKKHNQFYEINTLPEFEK